MKDAKMDSSIEATILKKIKNKKIGIFGTGKMASEGVKYLTQLGVEEYYFFDNNSEKWETILFGKKILSPDYIDKDWFIIISTFYFKEISMQLNKKGLEEVENYINIPELEYYDAIIKYHDAPRVPVITYDILDRITTQLSDCVDIKNVDWLCEKEFWDYEKKINFGVIYDKEHNNRYTRKIKEYFIVEELFKFVDWGSDDIYLDIGAASSPFAKYLRENSKINAYAVDLEKGPYDELDYYIQGDATHLCFDDESIKGISLQSAFEMFIGDADTQAIKDMARVLKKSGKICILPLYMYEKFLSTTSPIYYKKGFADKDAIECIRTDSRTGIPLGRFYSVQKLEERVLSTARECGLKPIIYVLPDSEIELDEFVYLKYILVLEK